VAEYVNNHFNFWIDNVKTEVKLVKDDPFGDDPPKRIVTTLGNTDCVFRVKKEIEDFMAHVLAKENPYYFTFVASDLKRVRIYVKLAEKIGRKYGYFVHVDGLFFHFYKV
jgi:hypothetical protein